MAECAALLLGLDPDQVQQNESRDPRAADPSQVQYLRLKRLLLRARAMGELDSPARPRDFLEWAASNGLEVPDALLAALGENKVLTNWRRRYYRCRKLLKKAKADHRTEPDLHPRSRHSLYTILLAMAIEKYGFDPNKNNAAAKLISGTLAKHDFEAPPGEQTIRSWLQEARDEVLG
jgi:hypothetical protein